MGQIAKIKGARVVGIAGGADKCRYAVEELGFRREMSAWIAARRVKARETIVEGLANAPTAFIDLLQGRNFGKLVVRAADA